MPTSLQIFGVVAVVGLAIILADWATRSAEEPGLRGLGRALLEWAIYVGLFLVLSTTVQMVLRLACSSC